MKKFMSLVCLLTLMVMSAQAQLDQQKLDKMMRQLIPARTEKAKIQKALQDVQDSVLYSFDKHEYAGNNHTVTTYYNLGGNTFGMEDVQYTVTDNDGRVLETGHVNDDGDTLEKNIYQYFESNANVVVRSYENSGEEMMQTGMTTFYGVKNIDSELLNQLMESIGQEIMICDSLQMMKMDEEDTTFMSGYFTFDANGMPATFIMGVDFGGMAIDVIAKMNYTGNLLTSALLSASAMGGLVKADLVSVTLTYTADGQLMTAEIIPVPNEIINIGAYFGIERTKMERTYSDNQKLFCEAMYTWNQIDSVNGEYKLADRSYYTYYPADGKVDTVYNYGFGEEPGAAVANVSRIEVVVSPNPVKDMLNIRGQEEATEVSIFNAEGRLVVRSQVEAGEGSINMQSLSRGAYFVKLQNRQGVSVQQIVKQ